MAKTVLDVLEERLQERVKPYEEAIVRGTAVDFAAYKGMCGVIQGLTTAINEVRDFAQQVEHDDDE